MTIGEEIYSERRKDHKTADKFEDYKAGDLVEVRLQRPGSGSERRIRDRVLFASADVVSGEIIRYTIQLEHSGDMVFTPSEGILIRMEEWIVHWVYILRKDDDGI